jgi:hypothetical protein
MRILGINFGNKLLPRYHGSLDDQKKDKNSPKKRRIKRNPITMVQTKTSVNKTSTWTCTWPWAAGLALRSKRVREDIMAVRTCRSSPSK